jgi:2-amino-4-hydroxy-6-hydroxymethyldihydropteridine diphosphokinase
LRAFLGLGSNVGDRFRNIRLAVGLLDQHPGIDVTRVSAIYETEALDDAAGQRDFFNAVVETETRLAPRELLGACKEIELRLGREPGGPRHAPRTIDIDLLLLGDLRIEEDDLLIPHPDLERRRFVLTPLLELAPELPFHDALAALGDEQRVTLVDPRSG